jgi:hypothetical protein
MTSSSVANSIVKSFDDLYKNEVLNKILQANYIHSENNTASYARIQQMYEPLNNPIDIQLINSITTPIEVQTRNGEILL